MKTKLTLTIDEALLPSAKRHARAQGVSLSQLVEDALRRIVVANGASFSSRWRGRFRPSERDDARYRALAKKYL